MLLGPDRDRSLLPHSTSAGLAQRLWAEIIQSLPQSQSGKLMVVVGCDLSWGSGQNTYVWLFQGLFGFLRAWWLHSKGKHSRRETSASRGLI